MGEEHLTRCWVMTRDNDRDSSMTCDLFNTSGGLEARCYCGKEVVRLQRVSSMGDAINLCAAWKATYRAQGWIELVP